MARIQKELFGWQEVDALGDLKRLQLVRDHLPDEELVRQLEGERGKGRDDYPVRATWNSLLAGVVYQHRSIEELRRELSRNGQLRQLCGFRAALGERAVPPAWAYTRFLKRLDAHLDKVQAIFDKLVEQLGAELPEFGRLLAMDGKALHSHARPRKKGQPVPRRDGRRDVDADFGCKKHIEADEDGVKRVVRKYWYGYKAHLVVDATYELPVAYEITKASVAEQPLARTLLDGLESRHGWLLGGCEELTADKGYDDGKLIRRLWDKHQIKAVIAIRDLWQDGEKTRRVSKYANVVYDHEGGVFCHATASERHRMAYGGFEAKRETLKYRCPAQQYGFPCARQGRCRISQGVRIPLSEDRRVFTPLARSSKAWKRAYKRRTAVERVNSRLDVSFGFEEHFIRGLAKMRLRMLMALTVMLGMALGRIKEKKREKMRSLVAAA
jgi:hypothetical protein